MKTWLLLVVGVLGVRTDAVAQVQEPDVLYLTGESDSGASVSGGGGEAAWLHAVSLQSGVIFGGASMALADVRWTYGTVGAFTRRRTGIYSGRLSLGSGQHSPGRFAYVRSVGTFTIPIGRSVYVEAEGQYARALSAATRVFTFGASYSGIQRTSLRFAYHTALSGLVHAEYISGRGDLSVGRFTMLGGITATARATAPVDLRALDLMTHAMPEYFVGSSVGVRRSRVMCSAQVLPQPSGHALRVTMTVKLPLGSSQTPSPEVVK